MQNLKRLFSSRIFKWLFNDYTRIIIIAFISLRLYYVLQWEISSTIENRTWHGNTLEVIYTAPYVVFFVIIGTILAIVLQKGPLLKSLLAGSIVSLLILFNFPLFRFHLNKLDIFEIHRYFAIPAFPFSAAVVIITGFKKRISAFARDTLAVVLGFVFIAGLGQWVFGFYKFLSSPSYKNSISFEIPIYPGSFDIQFKTQHLTGMKSISFKKEAECSSYDIMNFYNELWQERGFSAEFFLGPLWFQIDSLGTDSYLYRRYLSLESQLAAVVSIHQVQIKSKNACTQNIEIGVAPYPAQYDRLFSKYRRQGVDQSLIEWLILANFQFYAEKPLDRFSPTAREWFNNNFSNKNPSALIRDFDGNGLSDVAVLACPAPAEKTADIFAIFSQEIVGCYRKIYSGEAPDDSFILPVAKGTVLNSTEGADISTSKIPMVHGAIALSRYSGDAVVYYWQDTPKTIGSVPIKSDRIIKLIEKVN